MHIFTCAVGREVEATCATWSDSGATCDMDQRAAAANSDVWCSLQLSLDIPAGEAGEGNGYRDHFVSSRRWAAK